MIKTTAQGQEDPVGQEYLRAIWLTPIPTVFIFSFKVWIKIVESNVTSTELGLPKIDPKAKGKKKVKIEPITLFVA